MSFFPGDCLALSRPTLRNTGNLKEPLSPEAIDEMFIVTVMHACIPHLRVHMSWSRANEQRIPGGNNPIPDLHIKARRSADNEDVHAET